MVSAGPKVWAPATYTALNISCITRRYAIHFYISDYVLLYVYIYIYIYVYVYIYIKHDVHVHHVALNTVLVSLYLPPFAKQESTTNR